MTVTIRNGTTDGAIQYNGSDVIRVDSGRMYITPDNTPKLSVYLNASVAVTTTNTWQKSPLNAKSIDSTTAYDNVTNFRYTPLVAGYYMVAGGVYFNTAAGTTEAASAVYKNGVILLYGTDATLLSVTVDHISSVSGIVYLNGTTDYLELWGKATFASTAPTFYAPANSAAQTSNFLSVNLIARA